MCFDAFLKCTRVLSIPPRLAAGTLLSVVVPCFDEEAVIGETRRRLVATLETVPDLDFECVYIDDGSRDAAAYAARHIGIVSLGRVRLRFATQ